jgi:hypothetical protein
LLFAAALLCKAVAVPLPLVLLILDVYPLGRLGWGRRRFLDRGTWPCWLEKLPYFALSAVFAAIAVGAKDESRTLATVPFWSEWTSRIAHACYGVGFYPAKTFWPVGITAYYPLPPAQDWGETPYVLGRLALIAITVVLIVLRRTHPGWLAGWLSYLVLLAPNAGLVRIGNQIAADRYGYVAMFGLVAVLAAALAALLRRRWGAVALVPLLALLAVEIGLSREQCAIWHDSVALWRHAHDHGAARDNTVLNNLGFALTEAGRPAEALPYLRESLARVPNNADAHHSLGAALAALGRDDEARTQFLEALQRDPLHGESRRDLDRLLSRRKASGTTVLPGR